MSKYYHSRGPNVSRMKVVGYLWSILTAHF